MTPGRAAGRRPSETFGAWITQAPARPDDADAAWTRAEDGRPGDGEAGGEASGGRRRRLAVSVLVVVALVAGARIAGVDLPEVAPAPTISVEEAGPGGGAVGGDARWEVSGRPVPGDGDDRREGALADAPVGRWWDTSAAPVEPRAGASALWAGPCGADAEPPACGVAVFWGGGEPDATGDAVHRDGAAYDPASDRWWAIPEAPVRSTSPLPAVWGRGQLYVWGGADPTGVTGRTDAVLGAVGAVYDPRADAWEPLPAPPISGRTGHALVWTGREVVVWGGGRRAADGGWLDLDDGAAYDPQRGTWRLLPLSSLAGRTGMAAVANDHRVVVWGGREGGDGPESGVRLHDGAVYNAFDNSWELLPELRAQPVRDPGEAVDVTLLADGDRILLAGPFVVSWRRPVYAVHELGNRRWRYVDTPGATLWRGATVVGDPDRIVVWGGRPSRRPRPDGAVGIVRGAAWPLPDGVPPARDQAVAWTGEALVVWGGENRVDPRAGVWSAGPAPGQQVAFPEGWP